MVGAGGNGSIFLSHLCRIHQAWTRLGGEPFAIDIFDPDTVTEANLARQVFCEADLGCNKALVLAQRMRGFYGIEVEGHDAKFDAYSIRPSVIVGCVDNLNARRKIAQASAPRTRKQWDRERPGIYWLDLGNGAASGQVILGGHGLPTFFDVFPGQLKAKDRKDTPSCSMAEALEKQDLFINSTVATLAGQLLWQLMRRGGLNHHGYFVNLANGRVLPLEVPTTTP